MAYWITAAVGLVIAALIAVVNYAVVFPRLPFRGPLPPLSEREKDLATRLRAHVEAVASKPHSLRTYANLQASAAYIERTLASFGFTPVSQSFEVEGKTVRNIEVVLERQGAGPDRGSYVIGAHYDSPDDTAGANDNGTGVAALLELARLLTERPAASDAHRLRLVFFVNEEQPYSRTEAMGSWRYAKALSEAGEKVAGMIALETIGYFSDKPGSQSFPKPFGLIYPDIGNFVAFVGLPGSRRVLGRTLRSFRREVAFPAIGGVAPAFIEGVALSDHWSFHQFGFPAFMITDTAPFRNPYYHRLNDLPKNVDHASLARVTSGLDAMLRTLLAPER